MITLKTAAVKVITAMVLSLTVVLTTVSYVAAESVAKITVNDSGKISEVVTHCITAEDILSEANIEILSGDKVEFNLTGETGTINITRSFEVYITKGNQTTMLRMTEGTVAMALENAGITLSEDDICNMETDTLLTSTSYIDIISVSYTTESYEEIIPFTTRVEYSSKLEKGKTEVTGGENGVKTVTVKSKVENGAVVSTEKEETVTKEPVEKVTVIGTKVKTVTAAKTSTSSGKKTVSTLATPSTLKLDSNGVPTSYKKSMTFKASAYTSSGSAKCSTGVAPQTGYIAVNPNIIPYGTKMYIVSNDGEYVYGYAIAADTGGFAKRNPYMVDLYFNSTSACRTFGIRNVTIYFL